MAAERPGSEASRAPAVDALRGWAVVSMVVWHTADGWLDPGSRAPGLSGLARSTERIGGHAAPLFLLLVGVSVALAGRRGRPPPGGRLLRRAGSLIAAGFVLSLANWLLDSLGISTPTGALVAALAAVGMGLLVHANARARQGRSALRAGSAGASAIAIALTIGCATVPDRSSALLRIDVLHVIGLALLLLAAIGRHPRAALALAVAVLVATPWVAESVSASSTLGAWLAQTTSNATTARFPSFPWLAYPLIGLALGHWLVARDHVAPTRRAAFAITVIGVTLAFGACEWLPHGYRIAHVDPSVAQLVRAVHRVGVATALFGASCLAHRWTRWVTALGRVSLVLYVTHLELAYGIASRPLHHRLAPVEWVGAVAVVLTAGWAYANARPRGFALHATMLARTRALLPGWRHK